MFESLTNKFSNIFKKLRSKGKLSEKDITGVMKDLQMVLLESDVHYRVVKDLINRVRERALEQDVLTSVTPGELVIKILWDEIRKTLGGTSQELHFEGANPALVMLVGLQGSGKTTTCGKLGVNLKEKGFFPALISTDTRRPAAKEQLRLLAESADLGFFDYPEEANPTQVVKQALRDAQSKGFDVVVVDTAGRLHVEEELLSELRKLTQDQDFQEILLVLDATTGQEAVKVAQSFREWIEPTGLVLTKVDTDARGGAVLSIVAQTGWPVKFVGVGEKLSQFEVFHPDRMASRIMGMGDTLSLIEKIEKAISEEERQKVEEKLVKKELDFNDFLEELSQMKSISSLEEMVSMLPGNWKNALSQVDGEKNLKMVEAIIRSMTAEERTNPYIINSSRKKRIAHGSGTSVQDVNRLLKQFEEFRRLWKKMQKGKNLPFRGRNLLGWRM